MAGLRKIESSSTSPPLLARSMREEGVPLFSSATLNPSLCTPAQLTAGQSPLALAQANQGSYGWRSNMP